MAKRARPGDVLEVVTPGGLIYLHFVGKHPEYGDAVAVCPRMQAQRPPVGAELFRDSYVGFYPAGAAVAKGLATVVGHLRTPGVPRPLRRAVARFDSRVKTWIIEDGQREVAKEILSHEERKLPIAAIWNHAFLVDRVASGWRPELEGVDEAPRAARPVAPAPVRTVHAVLHYLYFPTQTMAAAAAADLRANGFATEERLGADGVKWLVLAIHRIVPSDESIAAARSSTEALAVRRGGEYDRWEIETDHHS